MPRVQAEKPVLLHKTENSPDSAQFLADSVQTKIIQYLSLLP